MWYYSYYDRPNANKIYQGVNPFEVIMKSEQNFTIKVARQASPLYNFKPRVIGGSLTFEMDVSDMDCGCLTGAYLVESKGNTACLDMPIGSNDPACKRINLVQADKYNFGAAV